MKPERSLRPSPIEGRSPSGAIRLHLSASLLAVSSGGRATLRLRAISDVELLIGVVAELAEVVLWVRLHLRLRVRLLFGRAWRRGTTPHGTRREGQDGGEAPEGKDATEAGNDH
uniref:Uncharacterized protein n=1 Tax=Alexandrium andersonii TaxID=327968 RepID=A0A7S2HJ37_9DINO